MKKILIYFSFLGSIITSNIYLTSCNKSNETQHTNSEHLTTATSFNSNSSFSSSDENKINEEEVFDLLMKKRNTLSNITNYSKGFTSVSLCDYKSEVYVLDDKSNYGELNTDGNKWTSENEKDNVKNDILENYSYDFNYSYSYENKIAFDLQKKEGFQTYNEKDEESTYYSYNYFYTKESNNYYSYNIDELERYTIGEDYYKEIFSYHLYLLDEIDLSEENNSLSLFITSFRNYYQDYYENVDVSLSVDKNQEDNSYLLTVTIAAIDNIGNTLYGYSSSIGKEIIKYSFNEDYLKVNYTTEIKYEYKHNICDKDDSGYIVIENDITSSYDYLFLTEYDNNNCPSIDDVKESFIDEGYVGIDVEYYIDGHYIFNSLSDFHYNDKVSQLRINGYDDCFKSNMVWYLDEKCTIPFNEDTWPCYSLNLYTTLDSLNDDYYFVAHYSFTEEEYEKAIQQNNLHYYYDIMKKGEGSEFIDFKYAYFNDKLIYTKDEIIFIEGKINYLILILDK